MMWEMAVRRRRGDGNECVDVSSFVSYQDITSIGSSV